MVGRVGMSVPEPGTHGGDVDAVARALGRPPQDLLDLSASLNPFAPDLGPLVAEVVDGGALTRYPDAGPATVALAEALGVEADRLVLTNGGAEAIALVAERHPGGWVEEPEFALYRRHLRTVRPDLPRWRSNPSSPLGSLAGPGEHAHVWDEAFYPLATGRWTRGDDASWHIGSLTKVWACPGVRLGYVIAPSSQEAGAISERQPRWAVGGLALGLVRPLLARTDLAAWAHQIARARGELVGVLVDHGFEPRPSAANWVLVPGLASGRAALAAAGVLVRDCASFGLVGVARVAVPDARGLERLDAALRSLRREHAWREPVATPPHDPTVAVRLR